MSREGRRQKGTKCVHTCSESQKDHKKMYVILPNGTTCLNSFNLVLSTSQQQRRSSAAFCFKSGAHCRRMGLMSPAVSVRCRVYRKSTLQSTYVFVQYRTLAAIEVDDQYGCTNLHVMSPISATKMNARKQSRPWHLFLFFPHILFPPSSAPTYVVKTSF